MRDCQGNGAGGFANDPADVVECVVWVFAQSDEHDVGPLLSCRLADLRDAKQRECVC